MRRHLSSFSKDRYVQMLTDTDCKGWGTVRWGCRMCRSCRAQLLLMAWLLLVAAAAARSTAGGSAAGASKKASSWCWSSSAREYSNCLQDCLQDCCCVLLSRWPTADAGCACCCCCWCCCCWLWWSFRKHAGSCFRICCKSLVVWLS